MTCTQVMYQPYASYLPYERSATTSTEAAQKKYQHANESSSPEDSYPLLSRSPYALGTTDTGVASPVAGPSSVIIPRRRLTPEQLEDSGRDLDAESGESCHKEAQYLSANCVIYMNYRGDAASVVDEHFHRALSQDSFNPTDPKTNIKAPSMSERGFPPSFWNSDYQPPPVQHQAVNYTTNQSGGHDFFSHAHAVASLHNHHAHLAAAAHHHQAGDHWHYSLGHPQAYSHNLSAAYPTVSGMSGRSFNSHQYGSFLLQSGHPARAPAVKTEPWATRYPDPLNFSADLSHPIDAASYSGHSYSNMTGLDASQIQEPPTKDLYWF